MVEVSTRDFRANYGKFLGMASRGEEVVLRSRNEGCFRLVPVEERKEIDTAIPASALPHILEALQEVKNDMEGKIKLPSAVSLFDEH